ncbi:hypothetical protein D3C83_218440 [compost metagenome]
MRFMRASIPAEGPTCLQSAMRLGDGHIFEGLDRIAGGENGARKRGFGNAEALVQHGFEQRS